MRKPQHERNPAAILKKNGLALPSAAAGKASSLLPPSMRDMNLWLSFFEDFWHLLSLLVLQLWASSRIEFLVACATGLLLAGLSWWLTRRMALSFNRQFSCRPQHHLFCGLAALTAFFCTLLFFAFRFAGDAAEVAVAKWETAIEADAGWSQATFRKTYEAVRSLRDAAGRPLEDFAGTPGPDSGQNVLIPARHEQSRQLAARTYAEEAARHFCKTHPLLSKILWAQAGEAEEAIYEDMKRGFASGPGIYPVDDAVRIARKLMRQNLTEQLPRVVAASRMVLAALFLLAQAAVLALLVRAALADIRIQWT